MRTGSNTVVVAIALALGLACLGCSTASPVETGGGGVDTAGPDSAPGPVDDCDGQPAGTLCDGLVRCSEVGECTCGDLALDPGEECDDGTPGCDPSCNYVCTSPSDCPVPTSCRQVSLCNSTTHLCEPGAAKPEGSPCPGGSCDGIGNCVDCSRVGEPCDVENECAVGEIVCREGIAECAQVDVKAEGESCAGGRVCDGTGQCVGCVGEGRACDNGDPCLTAVIVCEVSGPVCVNGAPAPAGQTCGDARVCNGAGGCADCDATPGAELCDGRDNDCDGAVDEGTDVRTWYRDADGDTWGNPATAQNSCGQPAGYVDRAGDCDDSTAERRPGLAEVCDGLDNDCQPGTTEVCPSECKPDVFRGRRYLFCDGDTSWQGAQTVCQAQRMRLVRIDDDGENQWIRARATERNGDDDDVWLGASDLAVEGRWVWTDGAHFWQGDEDGGPVGGLFERWQGDEPNNKDNEDCAEMDDRGTWNDKSCGASQEFVCERY